MERVHSPDAEIRRHVWISGQVQGVGYRWATQRQAQHLGVNGWVRNLPDGRVEAVFEGTAAAITDMLAWCQQGPPAAKVEQVQPILTEPWAGLACFEVIER